ncbi:uncharacterized protein LOC111674265, partial [Orussus abietinus]|uniref:uncharacterized protein LOC111674265 n=1 Tax=Orussus abietinus TaxID=222816 RepID=UPI000C715CC8
MFLINCDADGSYSIVQDEEVIYDESQPPNNGDKVLFFWQNLKYEGKVITRSDNSKFLNNELKKLKKMSSKSNAKEERNLIQSTSLPSSAQVSITLVGIGAQKSNKPRGIVSLTIKPHFQSDSKFHISAHVLPKLTSTIPSVQINPDSWNHLEGLEFVDPEFNLPGSVDIILGAEIYSQIIAKGIIKGPANSPIAQFTTLGWIISGPTGTTPSSSQAQTLHISVDHVLHDILQRFWQLEEPPTTRRSPLSADEQDCEMHFQSTHTRNSNRRYTVQLPFKSAPTQLGNSRSNALRMLYRLSKRLTSNPQYQDSYTNFLTEYESLRHMQLVPPSDPEPTLTYYLPHHGVLRDASLTTKLRVVFNGSSRTSTGVSLNDLLHTGAELQTELLDVITWFRQFRYVFSSNIEKMYRQIQVHPSHWDFQRILWINRSNEVLTFQLTTVTYGSACAPFLALRTLLQLIKDEGDKYPLAVPSLTQGRYVDDVFGGADSVSQVQETVRQ